MTHWTYTVINRKLDSLSETDGFRLVEVPNEFRSQRCSACGWVRKANRTGKTFTCDTCGFITDADLNAASNLELDLYEVPVWVRRQGLNREGFYWTPDGLYTVGHEPIVRDPIERTEYSSILFATISGVVAQPGK
ncbi:MAG: zinc ribbon domain-containing protein [Candidatus Bipolaricaulia bacterium]